jgi:hypothetical protein
MNIIRDALRWVQSMLRDEPVLTLAVVQSGVACGVGFGLNWSGEQVALFVTFMAAILGWVARSEVTPNVKVAN